MNRISGVAADARCPFAGIDESTRLQTVLFTAPAVPIASESLLLCGGAFSASRSLRIAVTSVVRARSASMVGVRRILVLGDRLLRDRFRRNEVLLSLKESQQTA
ncbi:hypothetical protein [Amycolatopsis sp. NBRC 101858]|uniref:hypothetical protein n=1 Tax=Amycolatopsis sp. NBRC 101858 TaxID=3032200 RepID=UPI002556E034|nr:hypothetical protein [Amycolatopsis sp. NBRC 101858]